MNDRADHPGPSPKALHAQAWADACDLIDRQLSPLGLAAMDALDLRRGEAVLDVGCGAGQTLLQLAARVGTPGRVVGVDIAAPLLEIARHRAAGLEQVAVIEEDAETLSAPAQTFDAVFSRFGVMSFAHPAAAFANFHRMLRPQGRLAFCCWRSLAENELDRLPLEAAGLPLADEAPFSFADAEHLRAVLEASGFCGVAIAPQDAAVSSGDLEATVSVLLRVGALGKIVRETPSLRASVEPRLRAALGALGDPSMVSLRAAVWIVTARR